MRTTLFVAAASAAAVLSLAAPASAKEGGSGGTTTTPTCSPVQSLRAQGDARAGGEPGTATIDVDYSVKPCDNKQAVTVETLVAETWYPDQVVWDDTAAPESGKFTVYGVNVNTLYKVTVLVRDAGSGALVGSATVSAKAATRTTA